MMYFNVHTHQGHSANDVTEIVNISSDFRSVDRRQKVSVGLHPWQVSSDWEEDLEIVKELAGLDNILAIGECGLDKICDTDFLLQEIVFAAQISIAAQTNKPLIIHCVKAFSECLDMLLGMKVRVIFHGINNRLSLVQPVIDRGYYLSFGKSLLSSNEAIRQTFRQTPLDQIFLETDDMEMDIREIYKLAASIKNIEEKEIALQLETNFLTVFGS